MKHSPYAGMSPLMAEVPEIQWLTENAAPPGRRIPETQNAELPRRKLPRENLAAEKPHQIERKK
jgi:hypothetical protein